MIPERRKEVRAVVMAVCSRAVRVEVQRSLARWTSCIVDRDFFEASRWETNVSRGELVVGGCVRGDGGGREELEDAILEDLRLRRCCLLFDLKSR